MSQPDWMKNAPPWVQEGRAMNEAEWLEGFHLVYMVSFVLKAFLAHPGEDRRHLLFGCACCRMVWDLLQLDAAKRLVELAERYADGEVSKTEFLAADDDPELFSRFDFRYRGQTEGDTQPSACARHAIRGARWLTDPNFRLSHGAYGVAQETCKDRTRDYIPSAERPWGGKFALGPDQVQLTERVKLLRDIFGNPFRPVVLDPAWRTPTVTALAQAAYEERILPAGTLAPDRLVVLADALEEAGCDSADLLTHLRGPGPHVRGCWALDLLLGKE